MGRQKSRSSARESLKAQRKSLQYASQASTAATRLVVNQDPSKPREEHHYNDFYPDLREETRLHVFVHDECSEDHTEQNGTGSRQELPHLNKPVFKQIPKEILPNDNSKIPKHIMKLGYREPNSISSIDDTYVRENDHLAQREQNNAFFEGISKNQMNFKSMYDMDEQDNYYLSYLNDKIGDNKQKLTHEIFEICITILENEWYHLERKIPPKIRKTYSTGDQMSMKASAAMAFTELYGSDDGIGVSPHEEQACAVCGESDCDNSNAIIFCDGCDIAVHQDCYGVIFIPEGQWLCRRCMISKKRKIRCQFCPSTTGAFKQTENGLWSHVLCGLWVPELYFASAGHMEPIEGIDAIPKGRWKLQCYICKQKMGACIQCANRNCFTAFHATCARRAGLYMTMSRGVQGAVLDKSTMTTFCHKHSPLDYNLTRDFKTAIDKTRLYFETMGTMANPHKSLAKAKKNTAGRWKTTRGTPIPPNYFIDVLEAFFHKLKLTDGKKLATDLTKYWCMKREMKRGAPLIRRTDPTVYTASNPEDIPQRLQFSKFLLKDISRLEDIGGLLVEKASIELERHQAEADTVKMAYFPCNSLISTVMDRMMKIHASKILREANTTCLNLSQIDEKVRSLSYGCVAEFISDLESFFEETESTNEPGLMSAARRIMREVYDTIENIRSIEEGELELDFNVDGFEIEPVGYRGPKLLKLMDLSDVEM